MDKEQIRAELKRRLPEYFDDFLLVGVIAGRQEVVIVSPDSDPCKHVAIRYVIHDIFKGHGTLGR